MSQYRDLNAKTPTSKPLVTGVESVYQSLDNLFGTLKGQRPFNVTYGANLDNLLMEQLSEDTAFLIFKNVTDAIQVSEPRVKVLFGKSEVTPDYDNNTYNVVIYFRLQGVSDEDFTYIDSIQKN